jgi:tetratricopeptide (TPR) repeat protein
MTLNFYPKKHRVIHKALLCVLCAYLCAPLWFNKLQAQSKKIDSLIAALKIVKSDTAIIMTNNRLSEQYWRHGEFDNAIVYAQTALKVSHETKPDAKQLLVVKRGEYTALNNLGIVAYMKGDLTEALKNFNAAQDGYDKILQVKTLSNTEKQWAGKGQAAICSNIGLIHFSQGNYPEALQHHLVALKRREEIGDKNGISISYSNIGSVYYNMENFTDALKNYRAGLKIKEELNDKPGIAAAYNNIGNVFFEKGDYPIALENFFTSQRMMKEIGDTLVSHYSNTLNNIGIIYEFQGKYNDAILIHTRSLQIKKQINDKHGIENSYISLGNVYARMKKFPIAKKYLAQGLALAIEIGEKKDIKTSYTSLFQLDSASGNLKGAYDNYKLAIAYRDSLVNEENTKKTVQEQMQFEFDKKEALVKAEQEKKDLKSTEEKRQQRIIMLFVVGCLLLVITVAVFIFRSLRINKKKNKIISEQKAIVERQKELVEEKQKEILDSIYYARRIQRALITSEKYVTRNLNRLNSPS